MPVFLDITDRTTLGSSTDRSAHGGHRAARLYEWRTIAPCATRPPRGRNRVPDSYLTSHLLDLVGREIRSTTSFPITDSDIRRWAIAVYHPEPVPRLFWDAEYAAGTVHGGVVAPEDFNPFAWMARSTRMPRSPNHRSERSPSRRSCSAPTRPRRRPW
jgi:hypothetical protein